MAKTQLDALSAMAADLDRARGDHAAFLLAERIATPMRRRRQRLVEEHRTERRVRQALADSWERRTSVEAIEELIARRYTGGDAKDQARRAAGSAILELIRADVFRASQDFARELPNELELFLAEYAPTASFPAEPEVPRLVELVSPRMDVVWSPG